MAKEVLHVVPSGDGWAVKKEGNERASSTHDTQKNAIDGARALAKEGDDIVIHRQDGSIRDRHTHTGANGDAPVADRPQAHDIWSVGTRVSWSGVLAGVVVAMAISVLLTALATAVGLTTMDQMRGKTITIVAATVWFVIMFVSLFAGGFVASRMTTRETQAEAVVIGALVWGTMFTLAVIGVRAGAGLAIDATNTANAVAVNEPFWKDQDALKVRLNLTDDQAREWEKSKADALATARNIDPKVTAWTVFFGMAVSIASAIGGALLGAGPDVSRRTLHRDTTGDPRAAPPPRETVAV